MKIFLIAFALLASLPFAAWSDIPPPQPTTITVANLTAFPGFKFSYSTDTEEQPATFSPLREKQVFRNNFTNVRLFVEDGSGEHFEWATVKVAFRAKTEAITIQDVRRDKKKIKVTYKVDADPAAHGKSAQSGASRWAPFALSGFSLGAVVILIRNKRAA